MQINSIKDDVEYYVEENQDEQFQENEFIYDDLDLDELQTAMIGAPVLATSPTEDNFNLSGTPSTNSNSPSPCPGLSNHSKESSIDSRKHLKSESEDTRVSVNPIRH